MADAETGELGPNEADKVDDEGGTILLFQRALSIYSPWAGASKVDDCGVSSSSFSARSATVNSIQRNTDVSW